MSNEQYLKSPCAHCNGRISFPASARGMSVACPHCGQQTVLNATASTPTPAVDPVPATSPAVAEKPVPKPVARPAATAAKPLTEAQKAAIAAARASSPASRPVSAKPDKKNAVIKTQWADSADDVPVGNLVRCDYCGIKIPAGAKACPDCGTAVAVQPAEETKPSWFRRIGLGLIFILTLVAAGVWTQYYLSLRPAKGKDGKPLKDGVELLTQRLEAQPGTALLFVRGTVTNHSDAPWFGVKVECELLDKAGVSLGKFSDSRVVLEAHKLFPFSISLLDPDAKSYTNLTVTANR